MKTLFKSVLSLSVIAYAAALIIYCKEVSAGIINAVYSCLNVMIPSLYAFMVISGFIISSGIYRLFSIPFRWISAKIFKLPCELFSVFLISSVAGYPVGAKMTGELYSSGRIDKKTAERMLGFCYMGGPAFFCGTAGSHIYSNAVIGIIIFLCIFFSNTLSAILSGVRLPAPENTRIKAELNLSLNEFLSSVYSGGAGMLKICGAIVFFSTFISIADASGFLITAASVLSDISATDLNTCICILKSSVEISSISNMPADISNLPLITALLSFGGFCVVTQAAGFIPKELSTHNFYLSRILVIFLSYFCCKLVISLIDINKLVPAMTAQIGYRQISPIPSVFLLIMTILLLSNNFIAKTKKM
ncbi:MAG: hypothetical protein IJZ72_05130 [Oscillospiraceae bacterium]|nr:hypothetical protein [Oscillospiraceae bacterium]